MSERFLPFMAASSVWARCPCSNQLCVLLKIDWGWELLHDFTLPYLVVKSFSADGLSTAPSRDERCLIWGLHTSVTLAPTFLPVISSSGFRTMSINSTKDWHHIFYKSINGNFSLSLARVMESIQKYHTVFITTCKNDSLLLWYDNHTKNGPSANYLQSQIIT